MEEEIERISPRDFLIKVYFEEKKEKRRRLDIRADILKLKNKIDFSGEDIVTLGNRSFISTQHLWWRDLWLENAVDINEGILYILDSFEKARSLEITSWSTEKSFHAPSRTNFFGIWIDHRPK